MEFGLVAASCELQATVYLWLCRSWTLLEDFSSIYALARPVLVTVTVTVTETTTFLMRRLQVDRRRIT